MQKFILWLVTLLGCLGLCACVELESEYFDCRLTLKANGNYYYSYVGTVVAPDAVRDILAAPERQQDWDNILLAEQDVFLKNASNYSEPQVKTLKYSGKCRYEIDVSFSGSVELDAAKHQGSSANHFMDIQAAYVKNGPPEYTFTVFNTPPDIRALFSKADISRSGVLIIKTPFPARAHNAARMRKKDGMFLYFWNFEGQNAPAAILTMAFSE